MNEVRQTCFGLTALALPLAVMAQGTAVEEQFFSEFPVVLTASRLAQRADETPASVTVIDRDMIRASGARELADVLRLVPGIVVGRSNGYSPMLGFNGLGDTFFRQLQVLVDGVSIYSPLWGGVEWGELPFSLSDVERIEVVRGANAAAYGSNAFLGVVNIITRDPAIEPAFQVAGNFGDNHISDSEIRLARSGDDWRYRLSVGQRADQGLLALPDTRRSNFANFRGHRRLNGSDEIRLQFGYVDGYGEDGEYSNDPTSTNLPRNGWFDAKSLQLRWTRATGADEELWVQFAHSDRKLREELPYTLEQFSIGPIGPFLPISFGPYNYPLNYDYDTDRNELELQQTLKVGADLRTVWGAQVREDSVRSRTFFNTAGWQTSRLNRLFGNVEWRPAKDWLVNAGAMYEDNTITGSSVSPSLGATYHFMPGQTLRARVAKARRTPTLFEARNNWRYDQPAAMTADLAAAPWPYSLVTSQAAALPIAQSSFTPAPLRDETILSREIGYLGEFPAARLQLDVTVFADQIRDLVAQHPVPVTTLLGLFNPGYLNAYAYSNLNWVNRHGVNVEVRWQPWQGARLNLAGSQTTIDSSDIEVSDSLTAPRHTVSMLFSQELPADVSFSLGYYRVGSMWWIGGGSLPRNMLSAYDRIDVRLGKRFRWGSHRLEVALVTQNVQNDPIPVLNPELLDRRTSWLRLQYEY